MAIFLYDIFWSHYCEKARFCLDFKRLSYTIVRVNPFTRRQVIDLGERGDVPVLKDGDRVVPGTDAIAAHLEAAYPDPPMLPHDAQARAAVLELTKRCDERLGPDARRVAYQVALENPAMLLGTILWNRAPYRWLNRPMLRLVEPRLRRKFKIYPDNVRESRERLKTILPELQSRCARTGYLVGDSLTLADIAAVSLLDPLELVPDFVRDPAYARLFAWKRALARGYGRRQRTPWISGDPPPGYPQRQSKPA
ncbi:MAG TPA: glutathione S-transferase family protein [Candidatus Polarisedimenticolia bacterium]|nr:glutathione S-transferase family protein [Candidatus Polarisedimenticolia bacterium]